MDWIQQDLVAVYFEYGKEPLKVEEGLLKSCFWRCLQA
jgi:hypothetical protein